MVPFFSFCLDDCAAISHTPCASSIAMGWGIFFSFLFLVFFQFCYGFLSISIANSNFMTICTLYSILLRSWLPVVEDCTVFMSIDIGLG